MKVIHALIAIAILFGPGWALAADHLRCQTSDETLQYREEFVISPAGSASYVYYLSMADEQDFGKICWSDAITVGNADGKLVFEGEIECVDGPRGLMQRSLNQGTMMLSGHWKGDLPCEWLK